MLQQSAGFIKYIGGFVLLPITVFAVFIFLHSDSAITQDLGRHLKLGEIIWNTKNMPTVNLFSFTYPDFPFLNHHWGSEVIFYIVDKLTGINGLIIMKTVISTGAFLIMAAFAYKRRELLPVFISSLISLEIMRERTEIRPEIFGFLFFTIYLLILFGEKIKEGKKIWILPFLNIFWVNLHISFIFGPVLYLIFIIDRIISGKINIKYIILCIFIFLSLLLNPFGIKGATAPIRIFDNYGYPIVENQSPFFLETLMNNPTINYFKIALIISFPIGMILVVKKYYFEAILILLMGALSTTAIRHFPFFALAIIYPVSTGLEIIIRKIRRSKIKYLSDNAFWQIASVSALLVFIILESYSLWDNSFYKKRYLPIRTGLGHVTGMKNAVDFFIREKIMGPVFNNFDIGSYLVYRLYPIERVFVDGRPEAYPVSFFQKIYIPMQENENKWIEYAEKYKIQTIIWGHTDQTPWARQFIKTILKNNKWKLVYFDDFALILMRKEIRTDMRDIKGQLQAYD